MKLRPHIPDPGPTAVNLLGPERQRRRHRRLRLADADPIRYLTRLLTPGIACLRRLEKSSDRLISCH